MTIAIMTAGMLALALLNVPIAIALGLVAVIAVIVMQGAQMLPNLALVMFDGASSFPLLAIPLFIFAGAIMNASSISRRLIAFASALFGFIRGGLSMVVIGASMFFAEISGSAHEALLARLAAAQRDVAAAKAQLDATSVAFLKTPRSEEARAARDRAVAELAQAQRVLDAGGDRDFERESAEDDARRTRI